MPQSIPKCNHCGRTDVLHTGFKGDDYYENLCDGCIGMIGSALLYRQYERQSQRRTYAADLVQPTERDYAKIRGADAARKRGWSEEELRKFG